MNVEADGRTMAPTLMGCVGELSSSPTSVLLDSSLLLQHQQRKTGSPRLQSKSLSETNSNSKGFTLDEMVAKLPEVIEEQKRLGAKAGSADDRILQMLRDVQLDFVQMQRYAIMDETRNYTRNLIATDDKTFTLLVLCWTPGKSSPIHDHPCDGCWMRVVQGEVRERRYQEQRQSPDNPPQNCPVASAAVNPPHLECTHDETFTSGVIFINDSVGYHKISNDSDSQVAVTLHLYSPPFKECRIWLNPSSKACTVNVCVYSSDGKVL